MDIPKHFEQFLSSYGPQLFDSCCGEPTKWGFKIVKRCSDLEFELLGMFGELECCYPSWFLITKKLTRDEAIQKYGEQTNIELGPRGGFRSVTFGNKTFLFKDLKPLKSNKTHSLDTN
jgi:hypothetical protein